jgi:hypothetical protein
MSDVLWWREESWWERRSLPLLGFNLAPRQLFILSFTGLLGLVLSEFFRASLVGRIGVLAFFLSIGFIFSTKRVKMAPVELQLYYRFVRKQGILRNVMNAQRAFSPPTILEVKPMIDLRPLLFGAVAGCLLATSSLSVLATGVALRITGEGLLAFVVGAGVLAFGMDRRLRRAGRAERANGVDKLFSGFVLSMVLLFVALHSSPLILIPEVASVSLVTRGVVEVTKAGKN